MLFQKATQREIEAEFKRTYKLFLESSRKKVKCTVGGKGRVHIF